MIDIVCANRQRLDNNEQCQKAEKKILQFVRMDSPEYVDMKRKPLLKQMALNIAAKLTFYSYFISSTKAFQ